METDLLALRILAGLHAGAVLRLDEASLLVIGSSDDCDVILADAGVASHHCVLQKQGDQFFLRTIEGGVEAGGRKHDPGVTFAVLPRSAVKVGGAEFQLESGVPLPEPAPAPAVTVPRHWSMSITLGGLIVTVAAFLAISFQISAHSTSATAEHDFPIVQTTTRSGASIAHDVAEVLRLSGINCEAQYNGDGQVTVSGHLGDPQSLSTIVESRAVREIVGLKRVVAVNLDHGGKALALDGSRIVSVVASADPYVVTADGSRYYVGASLPQGGKLAGVKEGEVLVERDGHTEHWKLTDPTHAAEGDLRPTGNLR
jgi:type III secretion protein D